MTLLLNHRRIHIGAPLSVPTEAIPVCTYVEAAGYMYVVIVDKLVAVSVSGLVMLCV